MLNAVTSSFREGVVILLFLIPCVVTLHSSDAVSSELSILEGAKKEKEFSLYTANQIENATFLLQQFKKKYPFITTHIYRAKSEIILNKVDQEVRAKKNTADVIAANNTIWNDLVKKKLLMKYKSPEISSYPKHFRDAEDYWAILYLQAHVMAYNTKLVHPKEAPIKYEDLLLPKWKSKKIGLDSADSPWLAVMQGIMGMEKGVEFMKKLAGQDLYLRENKTLLTNLLAAGEYSILANTYFDNPFDLMKAGAPIGFHPGSNPIPSSSSLVGISAFAPHPNAGKLYIDFVLSTEGQQIIAKNWNKIPSRPGIESEFSEQTKGYELYPVDLPTAGGLSLVSKQFKEIFRVKN